MLLRWINSLVLLIPRNGIWVLVLRCTLIVATAIISYPVINFILYVPDPSFRPLHLASPSHKDSFFLPQWGGIQILNPPQGTQHLTSASLRPAFATFTSQLLSLLGTPTLPRSIPSSEKVILSPWQLDGLVRQRAAENIVAAGGTMGSLARLIRKIPNMAIPEAIKRDVLLTLHHLDKVALNPKNLTVDM
jgi:GPI-anchor transamidase subunit S